MLMNIGLMMMMMMWRCGDGRFSGYMRDDNNDDGDEGDDEDDYKEKLETFQTGHNSP